MATGLPQCGPGEMLLPQSGIIITPSRSNPWREVRQAEQRYTGMQLRALQFRGLDPDTVPDVIVRQAATMREMWWPSRAKAPVYLMPCPIIGERKKNGRRHVLVITPDGSRKFVHEDGSILGGKQWSK
jgi:hypothetical protein